MKFTSTLITGIAAMAIGHTSAQATMTLLTGPPIGTHVGNLVTNGSFENGPPGPPAPGSVVFWATGTTNTPLAVPNGWTSSGPPANYAMWGSDPGGPPWRLRFSDILADGQRGMYFGNSGPATSNLAPTFNANGSVTFSGTPTLTAPTGAPVKLMQSVPTHLNPAPSYLLSFWTSGEDVNAGSPDGIFGLRVTNVLAGDPLQFFTVPSGLGALGASHRYEFNLVPINPSLPIDVEFWNWGHFNLAPFGGANFTTELVLDDMIVNKVPEPASICLLAAGSLLALRRRRA